MQRKAEKDALFLKRNKLYLFYFFICHMVDFLGWNVSGVILVIDLNIWYLYVLLGNK